jgi:aldehyde dehydrogenase (NAD+)
MNGSLLRSLNPAHPEEVLIELAAASAADVRARAERLRGQRPPAARAERLELLADELLAAGGELAALLVRDVAKTQAEAAAEVQFAATIAGHYAELLRKPHPHTNVAERGVELAGLITPFNFPCSIAVMKIAAAYGAGAASLWKPSPHALAVSQRLLTIIRSSLGECVEMIVAADEAPFTEIARQADALSFTGSAAGASTLWRAAAERPLPVQLELGSCNPTIIGASFAIEDAAAILRVSCFSYAGQKCSSTRRVLAPAATARDVFDMLAEVLETEAVGDPAEPSTTIPPLVSAAGAGRFNVDLEEWRAHAAAEANADAPTGQSDCYVRPSVMLAPRDAPAFQRDVFGPAAVVLPYESFAHAVALANATPYGLFAGLLSHDTGEVEAFRRDVLAGILKVNQPTPGLKPDIPSQGWRASGVGPGELGGDPFRPFLRVQSIYPFEVAPTH